eukprot:307144_1
MGQQVSEMYDGICGGDKNVEAEISEEEKQKRKDIQKNRGPVDAIDKQIKNATFRIEDYKSNKGKVLYIFYLKMFEIKDEQNGIVATDVTDEKDETKDEKDEKEDKESKFDMTKAYPFKFIQTRWSKLNTNDRKQMLEEVWDFVLENTDDENKQLTEQELATMGEEWGNLTRYEQKVYLYKFCFFVGPSIKDMEQVKDIDVVDTYNKIGTETMDDMLILNKMMKKESGCVIL